MNKIQHHMLTRILWSFLVIFFLLASSDAISPVFAQGGSIRGKVVADIPEQRKTLPGVVVTLSGDRLAGKKLQIVTDAEGQFDFQTLLAGEYVVTVEFTGFKKYE